MADGLDAGGDGGLGEGQAQVAESDDGEVCGHVTVLPLAGGDMERKPCGQNERAECQTKRKYD
ncbi:hypothetical protein GCM10010326_27750 [Streptomyces xanthochromogenes]|uniref:Uncharacterized protein n=1 Tax=Streptomyces xanthochromogenes TaxID=67384 RepID=A0ABQ3A537_9ACTN|nr:hypothetical protein GCM10010326_27750 [Streptomyces xanthochromogenes]